VKTLNKVIPTLSVFLLTFAVVGRATPAAAAPAQVYVGYQFLDISAGGGSQSVPLGVAAGVAFPLTSPWNVVGDFGWSRKSDNGATNTATSIAGGLRYVPMTMMGSITPYIQAVVGVEMDKSSGTFSGVSFSATDNNLMIQPGVGGTFALGSSLKGFVEADYRRVQASGDAANDFVLRAGVVFGK
jgi:hypothetical protein